VAHPYKLPGVDRRVEMRGIVERDGTVWVGTLQGLYRVSGDTVRQYTLADGMSSSAVRCMHLDSDGTIWLGTETGVDRVADDGVHNVYKSPQPITVLTRDREGSIWIGAGGEALGRLRASHFRSYTAVDGLQNSYVAGAVEDDRGNMWFATLGGLHMMHAGKITAFPFDNPGSNRLCSIAKARDGSIWAGTEDGVYRFRYDPAQDPEGRGPEYERIHIPQLPHIFCRVMYQDREGTLWLGTNMDGLVRYRDGVATLITTKDGLGHNAVRGICEDAEGTLWVTTKNGGLTQMRDGQFKVLRQADGLASDMAQSLYHGEDDSLWIGTRHGVSRFKQGKFTNYFAKDGMYSNFVYGFREDGHGNLWMSCSKGVFRVSLAQLDDFAAGKIHEITCQAYGLEHGLSSTTAAVANHPVVYRSSTPSCTARPMDACGSA
jgi:ligand-binding sensor domain-containing protein